MKKIITIVILVLIIFSLSALLFDWGRNNEVQNINQFATTTIGATNTPIIVSYPVDNQAVTSPIYITGTVTGNWFFEGSFPIQLIDSSGNVIGTTTAATNGDWATTSDINFYAQISYPKMTTTERALILLKNDNPSGDPARDQEKFIPVILK